MSIMHVEKHTLDELFVYGDGFRYYVGGKTKVVHSQQVPGSLRVRVDMGKPLEDGYSVVLPKVFYDAGEIESAIERVFPGYVKVQVRIHGMVRCRWVSPQEMRRRWMDYAVGKGPAPKGTNVQEPDWVARVMQDHRLGKTPFAA